MLRIDQITPVAAEDKKGEVPSCSAAERSILTVSGCSHEFSYIKIVYDLWIRYSGYPRLQTMVDPLRVWYIYECLSGQKHLSRLFQHGFFLIGFVIKL